MNYDITIASALKSFPPARAFQRIFPDAEHTIVKAKRQSPADGWRFVYEWNSRAQLHGRYVLWLVVAIDLSADGVITTIEQPDLYLVEVGKVDKGGKRCELSISQFEDCGWDEVVESNGDFAAMEIELRTNAPVDGFADYWRKSNPGRNVTPADGIALRAPFRFMN